MVKNETKFYADHFLIMEKINVKMGKRNEKQIKLLLQRYRFGGKETVKQSEKKQCHNKIYAQKFHVTNKLLIT